MSNEDGVLSRSRRNGKLDLGIGGSESGEEGLDEAATGRLATIQTFRYFNDLLHAL